VISKPIPSQHGDFHAKMVISKPIPSQHGDFHAKMVISEPIPSQFQANMVIFMQRW